MARWLKDHPKFDPRPAVRVVISAGLSSAVFIARVLYDDGFKEGTRPYFGFGSLSA